MNRKALKKAFYASLGKEIGVILGAGSLFHQLIDNKLIGIFVTGAVCVLGLGVIWYAEYQREIS